MDRSGTRIAAAILFAALAIRVAFVLATPDYALVHDALDYDRHAASIAQRRTASRSRYGRADRVPPAGVPDLPRRRVRSGVEHGAEHVEWARLANALVGTGIVALIGMIALQLWGRRVALVAMALGAIYIPLILVGQSVMSRAAVRALLLGGDRGDPARARRTLALGGRGGRADRAGDPRARERAVLLLPLGVRGLEGGRAAAARRSPAAVVAAALTVLAVDDPQPRSCFHAFVPVSTQLGSALAGTYNERGAARQAEPGLVADAQARRRLPADLRRASARRPSRCSRSSCAARRSTYIKAAPGLRADGRLVDDARMLDLGGLRLVDPHRGDDHVDRGLGDRGRDLLLDVRAAGAVGRVHAAGAGGAAVACGRSRC